MKAFLLGLFMVFFIGTASVAQTEKGKWLVGGSGEFSSQKTGDFSLTTISFNPNAGYFVINNLALGLSLELQSIKPEDEDALSTWAAGPFVRYYFVNLGPKAKLFGHGEFGFGSLKEDDESYNFTQWGIFAGPAFFLTPNTALEFAVGYGSQKFKDADDATNAFGVKIGFQIHLGK